MKDERKPKARSQTVARSEDRSPDASRPTTGSPVNSEFDFIARIKREAERARRGEIEGLVLGIGDDAAVFKGRGRLDSVITADLLVEDIDFRRSYSTPEDIGHKALAVSLSDIAAMGARPRWALLSIGLPQDVWASSFAGELSAGFLTAARESGVVLIGGDVSRTPERIVLDSIVIGEARSGRAVLRSGARRGDQIFVTGTLGGAAAGLQLLEHANNLATPMARARFLSGLEELTRRQTRPAPRLACGALVGERRLASAMIDLSDGLSSDLAHLCERSGVGALVEAARLPLFPLLKKLSTIKRNSLTRALEGDALELALHGGEDFELLFTARPHVAARLPRRLGGVRLTRIGEVRDASEGIRISRGGHAEILRPSGFDHFKHWPRTAMPETKI